MRYERLHRLRLETAQESCKNDCIQYIKDLALYPNFLSLSMDPESSLNPPQAVCMLGRPMEEKVQKNIVSFLGPAPSFQCYVLKSCMCCKDRRDWGQGYKKIYRLFDCCANECR